MLKRIIEIHLPIGKEQTFLNVVPPHLPPHLPVPLAGVGTRIKSSGEEIPSVCERPSGGGQESQAEKITQRLWSMSTFTFAVSLLALSFLLCEAGESKKQEKHRKMFWQHRTLKIYRADGLELSHQLQWFPPRKDFNKYGVFIGTGNPCCSEPCQNRGVCTPIGKDSYECDCTLTGYAGPNCTTRKYEGSTGENYPAQLVFLLNSCSLSRLHLSSRVPHLGQSVPEAVAQHCPLPSHPLQGLLEHRQQHLLPQGRHHEIRSHL